MITLATKCDGLVEAKDMEDGDVGEIVSFSGRKSAVGKLVQRMNYHSSTVSVNLIVCLGEATGYCWSPPPDDVLVRLLQPGETLKN